jgi:homoserine kinase type II
MPEMENRPPFSIMAFIRGLAGRIKVREPGLFKQVQAALEFLEAGFGEIHDRLPLVFCHGDFHAFNIIWSETGIKAVIDWEFSGRKPAPYDAAMMIGCLGSENPDALAGPLVLDFIDRLKAGGFLFGDSLAWLAEFVLSLRFAWLSEWLRQDDREMIEMETAYLNILLRHREDLRRIWKTYPEAGK